MHSFASRRVAGLFSSRLATRVSQVSVRQHLAPLRAIPTRAFTSERTGRLPTEEEARILADFDAMPILPEEDAWLAEEPRREHDIFAEEDESIEDDEDDEDDEKSFLPEDPSAPKMTRSQANEANMPRLTPLEVASKRPIPVVDAVSIDTLLQAGLHLGHSTTVWHPRTLPYIFGTRSGISIINLDITLAHLRRASAVLKDVAYAGGIILFIGTRDEMAGVARSAASVCGGYYISSRWLPGTISNAKEVLPKPPAPVESVGMPLEEAIAMGLIRKEEAALYGLEQTAAADTRLYRPDIIVVLNPLENAVALAEATKANIPTIGIIDSDCDPALVSYTIPGNDDSRRGVELIAGVLARAARDGVQRRQRYEDALSKAQSSVLPNIPAPEDDGEEYFR